MLVVYKKSVCVVVIGENVGTFEAPAEDFWTTIKENANTSVQSQNNHELHQSHNELSSNNTDTKIENNSNASIVSASKIKAPITSESTGVLPGNSVQVR